MVSIRSVHQEQRPDFEAWLQQLDASNETRLKLKEVSDTPEMLLVGQEMVEILNALHMDDETLQAALVYPYCQIHELNEKNILDTFGKGICSLIMGVRKMDAIKTKKPEYWWLRSARLFMRRLQIA